MDKFFDGLEKKRDEIIVPDSLKPDSIRMLLDTIENDNVVSMDVKVAGKKKIFKLYVGIGLMAGAIACIIAICMNVGLVKGGIVLNSYTRYAGNGFRQLRSYEALKEYLTSVEKENSDNQYSDLNKPSYSIPSDGPSYLGPGDMSESNVVDIDFSDTNVRTEGVLEPDCVKTNGKYIYMLKDTFLYIVKPDGEKTEIVKFINMNSYLKKEELTANIKSSQINDILLKDDRLIIVGDAGDYEEKETIVGIFDISNVQELSLIDVFKIKGSYEEARMFGNYMYVCTELKMFAGYGHTADKSMNYPEVNGEVCGCGHIYVVENEEYSVYSSITSFYIGDENKMTDHISVLSGGNIDAYVTKESIYLMSMKRSMLTEKTTSELLKFSYVDGKIKPVASTTVSGELEDVFCIDEYDGYLRLAITSDGANNLYVFDKKLNITGKITGLAKGERIYSAKFDGDIGYFVTYKQIDPLFTVDLSNPKNPKIIGELKIPGVSEYMHKWGEDKLLGIGIIDWGIKMSMFDISDPENVTEESTFVFDKVWNSDSTRNHKAVLLDYEKNIIGVCVEGPYNSKNTEFEGMAYGFSICSYENGEFKEHIRLDFLESYDMMMGAVRGLYIGDYIYVLCTEGRVQVVDMNTFEIVAYDK